MESVKKLARLIGKKLSRLIGNLLKWSGISVLALILLGVLLVVVAFAINVRDQALSPEAQALLVPPPNPLAPADNIYVAMAGFDAQSGLPVIDVGQGRIERYNRELAEPPPSAASAAREMEPGRLQFRGVTDFCQPLNGSMWSDVPPHSTEVAVLRRDNWELYQRYLFLHRLPGYFETARPGYAEPAFVVPSSVHKLYLADLVLHLRGGNEQARREALTDLREDVQLWRTVLTGGGGLLSKMLALAYLQSDSLIVADMIADAATPLPLEEADADLVAPLFDLRDWNIGAAFAWEFRNQAAVLRQIQEEESAGGWVTEHAATGTQPGWSRLENRLFGRFYKLQATENLFAANASRLIVSAAPDPKTFTARRPSQETLHPWMLPFTYNPIGRVLVHVAVPDSENAALRAWDGAALQRLVRAGYEIRRQEIPPAKIPAFLAQHPEWSTHPADGRAFLFDRQNLEIRVPTVAQQTPGRRFVIRIWQSASPVDRPRGGPLESETPAEEAGVP